MIFNPDLSKQAQEVVFSRKIKKLLHPTLLFNNTSYRSSLLTIYKTSTRSRLDYVDIIYDQAHNSVFYDKLESGSKLVITVALRGTSTEKIYQELGLQSLKSSRWFRKLCHFYETLYEKFPSYLVNVIPNFNRVHNTRLSYNIPPIKVRHDYFKNSFFPSAITQWNKLDH